MKKKLIEIEVPDGYNEIVTKNNDGNIIIEFIKPDKTIEMREFIVNMINGCSIQISEKYPDSVFYKKNDQVIFELYKPKNDGKSYFWCNYKVVWSVFYNKFGLNYNETQAFIKNVVEDTLKFGVVTPIAVNVKDGCWWKIL